MFPLLQLLRPIASTLLILYVAGTVFGWLLYVAIDRLADITNHRLGIRTRNAGPLPMLDVHAQVRDLRRKVLVNARRLLITIEATGVALAIIGLSFTAMWNLANVTTAFVLILGVPVLVLGPSVLIFYMYHRWKIIRVSREV